MSPQPPNETPGSRYEFLRAKHQKQDAEWRKQLAPGWHINCRPSPAPFPRELDTNRQVPFDPDELRRLRMEVQWHEAVAVLQRPMPPPRDAIVTMTNEFSRKEVQDKIDDLVEGGMQIFAKGHEDGEEDALLSNRLKALNNKIRRLWDFNVGRIQAEELQYMGGLPISMIEVLQPPTFKAHRHQRSSGFEPCLNCTAKNLSCTHTIVLRGVDSIESCRRCARSGEPCWAGDKTKFNVNKGKGNGTGEGKGKGRGKE